MSKEIKIGDKKISSETSVTLNLKTIFWILGIVISLISGLFTITYFDIKSSNQKLKEDLEDTKVKLKDDVREIIKKELKGVKSKNIEFIEDIAEVKGDIKVILDRTSRVNNTNNTHTNAPPEEIPISDIPER